jgi:DNA polymerase
MQACAIEAVKTGRPQIERGITFTHEGFGEERFLTILLPSGRKLFYVKPFLEPNKWGGESISFYTSNQTTKKWQKTPTYGGKLVENIIQAIARDCLAVAMQRLDAAGFKTIMHIHDEAVMDVPIPQADLKKACDIMGETIPWAPGLLLRADGFISKYYRKD